MIRNAIGIIKSAVCAVVRNAEIYWFVFKARLEKARILKGFYFRGNIEFLPNINLGRNLVIDRMSTVWMGSVDGSLPKLSIGDGVYIGERCYLGSSLKVSVGANCLIGASSYIIDCNHRFGRRDIPINAQGFKSAPISIEEDVWIGAHCVILPGVTIGRGAIVGAGSVVNKSIPEFEIWAGIPAKIIGTRGE